MTTETEISARLRATIAKLRTTPMPLADLIPLMQSAADECDRYYNGMMAWKDTAEAKDATQGEGSQGNDMAQVKVLFEKWRVCDIGNATYLRKMISLLYRAK